MSKEEQAELERIEIARDILEKEGRRTLAFIKLVKETRFLWIDIEREIQKE